MKNLIAILALLCGHHANAYDMSKTENYQDAYNDEGYIGGCSLHEDYEGVRFTATKVLVPYTETNLDNILNKLDPKLVKKVEEKMVVALIDADDISVDLVSLKSNPSVELIRLNVGIGGGNGFYQVFKKIGAEYKLLTFTFDGEVEFCDHTVWKNR